MATDELSFKLKGIDDLDALKDALVVYEEEHLRRYPSQWLNLAMLYFDLKTCLDELLANIFKHGYPTEDKTPAVVVVVRGDERSLSIELTDNGIPFDVSSYRPEVEREVLLGLSLVRKLTDKIEYRAVAGGNCLTVHKYLAE